MNVLVLNAVWRRANMDNVFLFTARADLDSKQNLELFIKSCREEVTAFGVDLPFDEPVWDLSESITNKGRKKKNRAIFSSFQAAKAGKETPTMSAAFLPFAQAYFRYSFGLRPTTSWNNRIVALRAIDYVLCGRNLSGHVASISHDILDEVRNLLLASYSQAVAAHVAGEVQSISDFLIEQNIIALRTRWLKGVRRPADAVIRVGAEADRARNEAMPSPRAIEAMAHLFTNASEPDELYIGSVLALLHCAPQRINETVRLAVDCEVEAEDLEKNTQYGIRLPSSKEFKDGVRWILPTMAGVARKAILNLKLVSEPARKIALWYERNPTAVYLPSNLEHLRGKDLSAAEVGLLLYGVDGTEKQAIGWCKRAKILSVGVRYPFAAIEAAVVSMLPEGFPYAQPGLLFSEALMACRHLEMSNLRLTYNCLIGYISSDEIASRISISGSVKQSIFERFNLTEDDGTPVLVHTHQMRHYLNTLAQSNNATQLDIAMWSGRADVRQNKAYDHVPGEVLLERAREVALSKNLDVFGGDLTVRKIRILVHREEATGNLKTRSAHITDYGMCTHEYSSSPCQIYHDCLNCNELVCVKGDNVKLGNIVRFKQETEVLLAEAENAEKDSAHGASRWVKHQRKTLEHANKLISILTDSQIPEGALVKLTGIQPASRIEQAAVVRSEVKATSIPGRVNKLLEKVKKLGQKKR